VCGLFADRQYVRVCREICRRREWVLTGQLVLVLVELVAELVGSDKNTGLGVANVLLCVEIDGQRLFRRGHSVGCPRFPYVELVPVFLQFMVSLVSFAPLPFLLAEHHIP
jgi:hypothetical protein